jgi:N-acetylglucosaminyldiphosphoundecaprenol N-acetyl-beta-D-mannosaminyltransferase
MTAQSPVPHPPSGAPEIDLPPPARFLECPLHPVTARRFIEIATEAAAVRRPLTITYLNAHCSNLAARDAEYRAILGRCDLVYADGQAVVWAARRLGAPVPERVNAGDFILDFCRACARKGLRLYLLGCEGGLAEKAARCWQTSVPGLAIAGTHHGFFDEPEEEAVAQAIRAARPDVLLVGMSAPRQEKWMARWAPSLGVPVVWCVGALFEYSSGARRRAPRWLRRAGLEWLFRLALEPGRLWRRYLLGNLVFLRRLFRAARARRA